jgi:hypothetical protein
MPDKCAGHSLKAPRLSISRTTGTISRDRWLVSFVLRKVLDSKLLQNSLLEVYLASSKQHFLVLSDCLMMELYDGAGVEHLGVAMEILSRFPNQVIALHTTNVVKQLSGRAAACSVPIRSRARLSFNVPFCRLLVFWSADFAGSSFAVRHRDRYTAFGMIRHRVQKRAVPQTHLCNDVAQMDCV